MSAARGRANQALYLARILLDGWNKALAEQDLPAGVLSQAYLPAVRQHLRDAYGWFLLAIVQSESLPTLPPAHTGELPPVPEGKVLPGEIRELSRLEYAGWLSELLRSPPPPDAAGTARQRGNLAVAAPAVDGPGTAAAWLEQLGALFERMGDSLDEF